MTDVSKKFSTEEGEDCTGYNTNPCAEFNLERAFGDISLQNTANTDTAKRNGQWLLL